MKKIKKNYNIGLDIGTNSVGWAVTGEENNIIKYNSKRHMWGVRLFDDANTAAERRKFRSNARRMQRRKTRIELLQSLLKDDINKTDKEFFDSLKLSMYHKGDYKLNKKTGKKKYRLNKYNIINDEKYTDKELYKEYKTIYHLRNKLVTSKEKIDIRLVYLAIHHIIKYRGNFLYSGEFKVSDSEKIVLKLENIIKYITEDENVIDLEEIINILKEKNMYKKQKIEKIMLLFVTDSDTNKKLKSLFKLIVGMKEDLSIIFKTDEKKSIRLTDDYDDSQIENLVGEYIEYFNKIKEINSWYLLQDILKGSNYISEAFIAKYDKYNSDLKLLKELYKKYAPEKYKYMFKKCGDKIKNYNMYNLKKCNLEDLYTVITKDLEGKLEEIQDDIKNDNFLVRINNRENGAILYQLNKLELEKILDNQSQYYTTIRENKDKIIKILSFKIPYYVGPLHNDINQPNNWSVRKEGMENERVLPWNFDDVIDKEESANIFIRRMTNKCTYLPEEDVIPRNSLLYSEYCMLNELNNIRCDGKKLTYEEKQLVINKLFKTSKTIKEKKLKEVLEIENCRYIQEISGFQKDKEFANNLASYIDFKKILGSVNEDNYEMIEQMIEWITIFEDKDILGRKIKKEYSKKLSDDQISEICNLNYSGWSKLSKRLLVELKYENEYKQKLNIMDILKMSNDNFMQIITNKDYEFDKKIKDAQKPIESKKVNTKFYEDNIATIPGSPAIKRGIWQTVKIVDEITKIIGKEPNNIFVEFAREDGEKKRTNTRRSKLEKAYEVFCNENKQDINREIRKNLKNTKLDITERLYLYYSQNGKCMYSGQPLDIESLELYQIDHIIPQCKIKDDSIDNKVLVYSQYNQRKLDGFINDTIINSQKVLWKKLFDSGLISQIKYFNLLNNKDSDKRTEGFIKRQLVETRQITKYVTNILENLYEHSNVFAIKSCLAHDFREKYDVLKIREMNDYHHAHDAYINSIIGLYINKRYPKMLKEFIYSDYIKDFKKQTIWTDINNQNKKYGFIVSNMGKEYIDATSGEIISEEQSTKDIEKVLTQFKIKDMYITKKLEEETGAFYNQNAVSVNKVLEMSNPLEIKEGLDPLKYGAYKEEKLAYSVLYEYINNGKRNLQIIGIPVKERNAISKCEKTIPELIEIKNPGQYEGINIILNKIFKNQLIYKSNRPYYMISSGEIKMCKQLLLNKQEQLLLFIVINNGKVKPSLILKAYEYLCKNDNEKCLKDNYIKMKTYINEQDKTNLKKDVMDDYVESKQQICDWVINQSIINVYDVLVDKVQTEYSERIGGKLKQIKEKLLILSREDKIKVIQALLCLTRGVVANLSLIGGSTREGRMHGINMNENWLKDVKFIYQSVTGIYEKKVGADELENNNSIK